MRNRWTEVAAAATCAVGLFVAATSASAQAEGEAVLEGMVFDSTEMKALAGATVAVIGTSAMGLSDADGRFRLEGLPAGAHWVSFFHDRLQQLGVSAPSRRVQLRGSETRRVELAVPSEETLLMGWCLAEQRQPGYAAFAGTVVDSLTGVPMPRAIVSAEPVDQRPGGPRPVEVRTDEAGYFRICSMPTNTDLRVQATFGASTGRSLRLRMEPGTARIQDLMLLMSAEGTLSGFVRDYVTGEPIAGARVEVLGTNSATLTDLSGRFVLDDLPPGRHLVTTDHLAFEERVDSVTIFSQEEVDIEVRMATEALEVEGLVVTARTRFGQTRSLAGTAKRADFITREEIEVMMPRVTTATDILRNMNTPGLRIREIMIADPITGVMMPGLCIEVSRRSGGEGCMPAAVALNDVIMPYPDQFIRDLDPNIIERIEILSPIDAVFQFGSAAGNGAVLIYTR